MMCPVIIIVFSISLLVLMAGLFFLNHTKREGLRWVSRITAYGSIGFASIVIIGGIVGLFMCGGHGKCHKGGHGKCNSEMRHHGHGGCQGNECASVTEEHHIIVKDGYCIVDGKKMKQEECMVDGKCIIKEECGHSGKGCSDNTDCCKEGGKVVEKEVTVTVEK